MSSSGGRQGFPTPSAAMRVRISEPDLLGDLVASLSRCGCSTERVSGHTVEVGSPFPLLTDEQARKEIAFYLAVWRVRHPGVRLTLEA
jgi:hypothetical protein